MEETVLVVEDSDDDFELLARVFKKSKLLNPRQRVESIRDAICYLKGEGDFEDRTKYPFPVLMLLDIKLPDGTGFEALRWLRQHPELAPAAVVVLTGSDVYAIRRSYAEGASSFLTKPLQFDDFANMAKAVRGINLRKTREGYVLEGSPKS